MTSKMTGNHEIIDLTGDQEDTAEYFSPVRLYAHPYGIITSYERDDSYKQRDNLTVYFVLSRSDGMTAESDCICVGPFEPTFPSTLKSSSKDIVGLTIVAIEYHPFRNGKPYKGDGVEKPNSGPVFFLNDLSNKGKKPAILYSVRSNGSPGPIWTTAQDDCGDVFEVEN